MIDRNKTELTQNITRLAALWLDGKGFKPVETEVNVARGWVADIAGVGCPTQTELIDLKLIKRSPGRWRWNATPELRASDEAKLKAWQALRDAIPGRLTATIEVKTSVGDYRGDRKWTAEWPTNLCYVAMPYGMIPADRWPKEWGVILFSQEGTTILKVFPPARVARVAIEQELDVILNIAVARDHVTRHARHRELSKAIRISEAERAGQYRFQNILRVIREVKAGKPVADAWRNHCNRELPQWLADELADFAQLPAAERAQT